MRQYGRNVLDDARRCQALMLDLYGEHKAEINLLEMALRRRSSVITLLPCPTFRALWCLARLVQRLHDGYYVPEEAARWAVTACIDAYEG